MTYAVFDKIEKEFLTSPISSESDLDSCREFINKLNAKVKRGCCILHLGWYEVK